MALRFAPLTTFLISRVLESHHLDHLDIWDCTLLMLFIQEQFTNKLFSRFITILASPLVFSFFGIHCASSKLSIDTINCNRYTGSSCLMTLCSEIIQSYNSAQQMVLTSSH